MMPIKTYKKLIRLYYMRKKYFYGLHGKIKWKLQAFECFLYTTRWVVLFSLNHALPFIEKTSSAFSNLSFILFPFFLAFLIIYLSIVTTLMTFQCKILIIHYNSVSIRKYFTHLTVTHNGKKMKKKKALLVCRRHVFVSQYSISVRIQ